MSCLGGRGQVGVWYPVLSGGVPPVSPVNRHTPVKTVPPPLHHPSDVGDKNCKVSQFNFSFRMWIPPAMAEGRQHSHDRLDQCRSGWGLGATLPFCRTCKDLLSTRNIW